MITVSAQLQRRGSIFHQRFLGEVLFEFNIPATPICVSFFSEPGDPSLEKKEPAAKLTKLVKTEESKAEKAKKQTTPQPQK